MVTVAVDWMPQGWLAVMQACRWLAKEMVAWGWSERTMVVREQVVQELAL